MAVKKVVNSNSSLSSINEFLSKKLNISSTSLKIIHEKRKEMHERRKNLTLFKHPITTLKYCLIVIGRFFANLCVYTLSHWFTLWIIFPFFFIFFLSGYLKGFDTWIFIETYTYVKLLVWWVGLGVLSSVGLGSGMHSGLLFLFPQFFFICATSEKCNELNFDARSNMWGDVMQPGEYFACANNSSDYQNESSSLLASILTFLSYLANISSSPAVSFCGLILKVFPYALMWGFGTALGELPPYAASYAAAKSKVADEEFELFDKDLHSGKTDILTRLKSWMMVLVEKYGCFAVVLLSCWPNVLFDLCGMVCGHFMMPFWRFFLALVLGKAIIKTILQSCFFVFLFSSRFDSMRVHIISEIVAIWPINTIVNAKFGSLRDFEDFILSEIRFLREGVEKNKPVTKFFSISNVFKTIIIILLTYFAIGCINQFAQSLQKELDEKEIEEFAHELVKEEKKARRVNVN